MVKFTLLEVHIDDPDFEATANARYASGEKEVEPGGDPPDLETDSRAAGAAVAALVGLAFLVVVAYLARSRVLEDDDDEFGVDG